MTTEPSAHSNHRCEVRSTTSTPACLASASGLRQGALAPGLSRTTHRGRYVRRITLGRYPLVSIADARAKAKLLLAAVTQGHDPAAVAKAQRHAPTFADLTTQYIERHAKVKKRSWQADEYMLRRYVPASWGPRALAEISRRDIRDHL
ncbi:MAG: DUF4102 domain-containing protein [bacterium]|nr:DUF4102 domain-containing protein [bacterium]